MGQFANFSLKALSIISKSCTWEMMPSTMEHMSTLIRFNGLGFVITNAIKRHRQQHHRHQREREILCIISIYTHPLSIILKLCKFETWRYGILSSAAQPAAPNSAARRSVIQHTYTPNTRLRPRAHFYKRAAAAAMKVKSRGTYYSYHLSKQKFQPKIKRPRPKC
jgi:hypothetical protein